MSSKITQAHESYEINPCLSSPQNGEIDISQYIYDGKDCNKLYYGQKTDSIANKYIYDRSATSIIFGVLLLLVVNVLLYLDF